MENKTGKETKTGLTLNPEQEERWANIFKEIQTFGTELKQILEIVNQCDPSNVIHSAKMTRWGEAHERLAQGYFAKAKGESEKIAKQKKTSGDDGGKRLSAAIDEQAGKPLANVCRDRDTSDSGKAGQMTSNPADVDAIVKRAWQKIHKGTGGCINDAVDHALDTYCEDIFKRKPFEVAEIPANGTSLVQQNCGIGRSTQRLES